MKPPMQIALNRATLAALVTVVLTGLISYSLDHNILHATILALSLAGKDLAVRGVVEGAIDTGRLVNATQGEAIAATPLFINGRHTNEIYPGICDLPPGEPAAPPLPHPEVLNTASYCGGSYAVPQNPQHQPNAFVNRYGTPPPR